MNNMTPPDRSRFRVIDGEGNPEADREGRIKRAWVQVEEALGIRERPDVPEGAYGHLSPLPQPEDQLPDQPPEASPDPTVTSITEAPGYRARQVNGPGITEGTAALDGSRVPVDAEGEVDSQYRMAQEARAEALAAHEEMPQPSGISQLEIPSE